MKVRGSLPYGTRFEPGLSGIHDLAAGIERTLVSDVDGSSRHYTINAAYVKSDQAFATRVSLADMPNAVVSIEEPETEDGTGSITVYKTSSSIDGALKAATVTVSPWATIECRAMNGDGTIDLSEFPDIVVVSQDGSVRKTYKTAVDLPSFVPSGKAGYIASLFGFQILENNEYGFEAENNRTLAVVGDYLIVGNSGDASKMVVMNRFTGKPTGLSVNATGISRSIHAITSDSAGHLVAVAYTNSSTLPDFEVWVWKNGIGDAPTLIFSKSLPSDPYFAPLRSANPGTTTYDIGRMVDVIGDVTSGEAIIGTSCIQKIRSVFIPLADGVASTGDGRRGVPLQQPRLDVVHDQAGALLDGRRQPVAGVCLRIGQRAAYGNLCSRERNIRYAVHGADDALLADGQDHGWSIASTSTACGLSAFRTAIRIMPAVSSLPDSMSPILRILPPEPLFRDFSSIRARAILRPERPIFPGRATLPRA